MRSRYRRPTARQTGVAPGRLITRPLVSRCIGTLVTLLATAGTVAAPASAVVVRTANGERIGVVPAIPGAGQSSKPSSASAASCTTSCSALTYHHGPVQHTAKVYLFF